MSGVRPARTSMRDSVCAGALAEEAAAPPLRLHAVVAICVMVFPDRALPHDTGVAR